MSTSIPLPRLGIDLLSDETQMPAGTVRAAYFGPRPDADLRRSTRHDEAQTNKAFMV